MKRSNRLFILLGVFLSIFAFVGVVVLASRGGGGTGPGASAAPTTPPDVAVVYAKADIKMGDTITADKVGVKTMSPAKKADLGAGTYSDIGAVLGKTAGSNIASGAYLYQGRDFAPPGSVVEGQSVAPGLASGMVGIPIEVDQINGVGTLIVPGDHVDVLLSVWMSQLQFTNIPVGGKYNLSFGGDKDVTSKIVFQNRKVVATLTAPAAAAPTASAAPSATPAPTDNYVHLSGNHMIVILEVKPSEAEVIRWAQRAEKADTNNNYITLALALRSAQDNDSTADVKTDGVTLRKLIEVWNVLPPDARGIIPSDVLGKITW